MKFSIITVCKNAEKSIQRTIGSVLQQNYDDYEYIIIDGASEDETVALACSYSNPRMKIISEPDRGISNAFNKGVKIASGEALLFLNSGDYFVDCNVLRMVAADMERYGADIHTYSISNEMDLQFPLDKKAGETCWEESLIPHQGTFVKKNVFEEVGLFNENLKIRMDYDFFCRCRKAGRKFHFTPIVIAHYDLNGISSKNKFCFEKEGLAIRLIYYDTVGKRDKEVMDFLTGGKESNISDYLEKISLQKQLIEKDHKIIVMMYRWLQLMNDGWDPSKYFVEQGYCNVAIYGFGMLGKVLHTVLLKKHISVPYVIDQNVENEEIGIVSWDAEWVPVDCIVITPFYMYSEIAERIRQEKGDFRMVSLEDVFESTR